MLYLKTSYEYYPERCRLEMVDPDGNIVRDECNEVQFTILHGEVERRPPQHLYTTKVPDIVIRSSLKILVSD